MQKYAERERTMALAKENFKSPKGNLKWAFVTGKGKEDDKGNFKYSVVVKVPEEEAKEAMAVIDQFWQDNKPKGSKPRPKSTGYKYEEDEETGERTGYVYFSFSTNTSFPSGDKKVVKIFNAKAPVREVSLGDKKIGEESIGKGIGTLAIYEYNGSYGTTLFLDAIQLFKFREYVGGIDASSLEADEDAEDLEIDDGIPLPEESEEKPRV